MTDHRGRFRTLILTVAALAAFWLTVFVVFSHR